MKLIQNNLCTVWLIRFLNIPHYEKFKDRYLRLEIFFQYRKKKNSSVLCGDKIRPSAKEPTTRKIQIEVSKEQIIKQMLAARWRSKRCIVKYWLFKEDSDTKCQKSFQIQLTLIWNLKPTYEFYFVALSL